MNGDYFFYIAAAYGLCFVVLGAMTLLTFVAWKKVRKEPGE
ncbi:MAG: heme exporter protein CcmD [Alphaproteobacteria bacterium]|nr:heme exporter protein CcmD [Alphaproteobacteria bacterium]